MKDFKELINIADVYGTETRDLQAKKGGSRKIKTRTY